jgi:hypothetical protein
VAVVAPLPCFGIEHEYFDPRCKACPHQPDCIEAKGYRVGRLSLDQAQIDLVPPKLTKLTATDPDEPKLQPTYELCHLAVFGRPPRDRLDRWPQASGRLIASCHEVGCTLRLFITTVMMAHQKASPDRPFYSNMLLGPTAPKRVERYRDLCRKTFGCFDTASLRLLTELEVTSVEERLLASEVTFGSFIVGHRLRYSGDPVEEFYRVKEFAMDPTWLATEPTYEQTLLRHVMNPQGTEALRQHRFHVVKVVTELKHHKQQAAHIFQLREAAAKRAIKHVLGQHGYKPEDFEVAAEPITGMASFWGTLGLAIQHHLLLQFCDGDTDAVRSLCH